MNREFFKKAQEVWNKLSYEDRLYYLFYFRSNFRTHEK